MIKSMTGYGKAVVETPGRKLIVEIKALNSKQSDLSLKLPGFFRSKEPEVRTLISQRLERGKIDVFIFTEDSGESSLYSINHTLAKKYHAELKALKKELGDRYSGGLLPLVMKFPDVLQTSREEMTENDWKAILAGINQAVEQVDHFRQEEGDVLEEDILARVRTILNLLDDIDPHEMQRVNDLRERLKRDFLKYSGDLNGSAPDQNRFEQELIYYFEKLDITEEKVRLLKHCQYFLETMNEDQAQGKKLGFITQEMGREINTLGSKAGDADIQRIVVQMKDELEKIKEQLGNIL